MNSWGIVKYQGIYAHNAYAYCKNDPIGFYDASGATATPAPTLSPHKPTATPSPSRPSNWEYLAYLASIKGPMSGPPNSHWTWLGGNGKWLERWMGNDGSPVRDRHWTDHGTPNRHSVPHDEDWIPDGKGGKKLDGKHPTRSPEDAEEPKEANWPIPESDQDEITNNIVNGVGVAVGSYLLYQLGKWALATIAAPYTAGSSYYVAAVM